MSSETQLWRRAAAELEAGRRAVLCTVIQGRGSIPRELGARMLVGEAGVIAGTVGGGCGEADVLVAARKAIAGAEFPASVEVDLFGDLKQDQIQACGGWMRVALRMLMPSDEEIIAQAAEAEAKLEEIQIAERIGAELTTVDKTNIAALQTAEVDDDGKLIKLDEDEWFVQRVGISQRLIIVGSGHVAQPLCEFASRSGFRVTIIDDRPSYVTQARFPDAEAHHVGEHAALLGQQALDRRAFVVIVTRGHQHDMASLRSALQGEPAYIGMIGSRRRAIETLRAMAEKGIPAERLAAVHSPIGLDIGALTPAEIAIAILGEMIAIRRGGSGRPLKELRPDL